MEYGSYVAGKDFALMYEARAARRAQRAQRAKSCGLGSGACCDSCANGGQCEAKRQATSVDVPQSLLDAGSTKGVGDLLDIIRDGVGGNQDVFDPSLQKFESTTSGQRPTNEFVAVPGGLGEAPDGLGVHPGRAPRPSPPRGIAPVGGRWVVYPDPPLTLLDLLREQPKNEAGWQQVSYQGRWYGLATPPVGRGGSGASAPPRAYRYVSDPAELASVMKSGLGACPNCADPTCIGCTANYCAQCGDASCLGCDGPIPRDCPVGMAWDPHSQQCISTTFDTIIDTYHHSNIAGTGAIPTGLGANATQIQAMLQQAQTQAAAHTYITDDYSDAIGTCQAAASATLNAEKTLVSSPSISDIGTQTGIIQQIVSDVASGTKVPNAGVYANAYQAASNAYQDFLRDSALAANQPPAPVPTPNPAPTPPSPSPAPGPITPVTPATPPVASTSYAKPILLTAAVAAASLVGYALYKRHTGGTKSKSSGSRARTRTMHSARTVRA